MSTATALDIAIHTQKVWVLLADFCHGLLAGMALMQAMLVGFNLFSSFLLWSK